MAKNSLFTGRVVVIATMHEKEKAIAPILEAELGVQCVVPNDFNTDIFGTFTRDIARPADQIATAKLKAKKALEITGETMAIASEGSFTPHPDLPFISANREIVVFIDMLNQLEIVGQEISTETNFNSQSVRTVEEAESFANKIGFPSHGLVVMLSSDSLERTEIFKGINTEEKLTEIVNFALSKSSTGKVHIETDMRALYNPTRMQNIAKATKNLIQKIHQICPNCACPGFDAIAQRRGLPCGLCNLPTSAIRSVVYQCQKCSFQQEKLFPQGVKVADPAQCMYCNP
ncbi:MAG: hypothetical protein CLLPBCKN_003492 [Chroococcidiopsis cubana SAG 39.79]|uniref:DUF6671 domain-containing protein n=1 Tax=Chroococcidiopsis cubana SAG 39.79 TaxID=388085 RepID=A0AB37ULI1_9CYAN|nr:DUF6671 family protein [Chroococcidiopsis cubana]MDZ4874096.1 hypothetical protein [Chroococcidiopsis cubana SAG 39.79]PSB64975.1 hypothetical protein C7B79_07400 [Chroococcidiopsis cubana CCALA 043]RUT12247.1 hypothetical protein DSM107010_24610 [Chroococcidiopsis cubana SAG 39.79]